MHRSFSSGLDDNNEIEKTLDATLEEAAVPRSMHRRRRNSLAELSIHNRASSTTPGIDLPKTPGTASKKLRDDALESTPGSARLKPTFWQGVKSKLFTVFIYYMMVLPALWLRAKTERYTKKQTLKRQIKRCEDVLQNTDDKEQWDALALQLDELRGYDSWRVSKPGEGEGCNASAMVAETQAVYSLIDSGNARAMGEFIRTHLLRNAHGSGSSDLFKYYSGSKQYVHEHHEALVELVHAFAATKITSAAETIGSSHSGELLDDGEDEQLGSWTALASNNNAGPRSARPLSPPATRMQASSPRSVATTTRQNSVEYQSWLSPVPPSIYSQSILDYALKHPRSNLTTPRNGPPVAPTAAHLRSSSGGSSNTLADSDTDEEDTSVSDAERLKLLVEAGRSYGRSCLLLSGGAGLGVYHIGVVRALMEAKALPRIMCGSSAGALMGSLICTRTEDELEEMFGDDVTTVNNVCFKFFEHIEDVETSVKTKVERLMGSGGFMDVELLKGTIRENCGDMTFLEAFQRTGRIFNVSVAADRDGEKSMLLNYINSPNVCLWAGVGASCCMPGMFSATELSQKDPVTNEIKPYMEGQKWFDGSVANDLPKEQLAEMFNCNYFIVSQVNPHVVPFAKSNTVSIHKKPTGWKKKLWFAGAREVTYWLKKLYRNNLLPKTGAAEVPYLMATQDYEGDLTIYPIGSVWAAIPDFVNLTTNPTDQQVAYVALLSLKRTRPHLNQIKVATEVERALEHEIKELAARLELGILRRTGSRVALLHASKM